MNKSEKQVLFAVVVIAFTALLFLSCSKKSTSSGGTTLPQPTGNNIFIQNFAFTPLQKNIAVGTTITWTNKDVDGHSATSDAQPPLFDSGTFGQNQTFSHTFNTAGTFDYHCTPHPAMQHGRIVVQ